MFYVDRFFQRLKENDVNIPLVNNSPCMATVTLYYTIWRALRKQILCTYVDSPLRQNLAETKVLTLRLDLNLRPG